MATKNSIKGLGSVLGGQQTGLVLVILAMATLLSTFSGHHTDNLTGHNVNNFLNANTLFQVGSDASMFAIMAVGMTIVIVSGGIDLSVGSIYALSGVMTAMYLRPPHPQDGVGPVFIALFMCLGIGVLCGLINGLLVSLLKVHPFIITLGTMWVFRGIAFVASGAESILLPPPLTTLVKATLGLGPSVYPVPAIIMLVVMIVGGVYLSKTVAGRNVYAVGGNVEASRYSGLRIGRIQVNVYLLSGLAAGIAAFVGCGFYGAAACGDAAGYELFVIASAVVGGASLTGGKGTAIGAVLGTFVIVLIRQSIRSLHQNENYESIIIGIAVIVAVVIDQTTKRLAAQRLAAMSSGRSS